MPYQVIDPSSGQTLETYPNTPPGEIGPIVDRADAAQRQWRERSFEERGTILQAAAGLLRERADDLAGRMATEMGKPLREGRAESQKCAWVCEYYAENAAAFLADETVATEATRSYVAHRPLGVVLAIMPWNFPLWQVFRFGAPALMAGNAFLLKHAPNVPGCAKDIENLLLDAGLPPGLVANLFIENEEVATLLDDRRIRAATLTGSTRAGRSIAMEAGRRLRKTVLELGGSDPYLILEDADLELAVGACAASRLLNSGQSCIAAKRFVVVEAVAAEFERLLVDSMAAVVWNVDPRQEGAGIGPMARADLREELHRQVESSIAAGARLLTGGRMPDGPGYWYPPTVLAGVRAGMAAFDEELFGPVAAIIEVADLEEAIAVANASPYGLGGAVFTRDVERGEAIARDRLEVGCAFVNDFVKSDPRLPFGGVGDSGYGRELGRHGMLEFVNVKTISVK